MNIWTQRSVELANQRNYLDLLYRVYPISHNGRREPDNQLWNRIRTHYDSRNDNELIKNIIKLNVIPIKDSYFSFLRYDPSAVDRNPATISRLAGHLYDMHIDDIYDKSCAPIESNRQIGPMFRNWINRATLGVQVIQDIDIFLSTDTNSVLSATDAEMKRFAREYLGYTKDKGLDFIARFNNQYVVGEAKFITTQGGNQNNQFEDAISTMTGSFRANRLGRPIIPISILDGVLYIESGQKMYKYLTEHPTQYIMSALVLRDFLYSL